jgi:hypothetical protein
MNREAERAREAKHARRTDWLSKAQALYGKNTLGLQNAEARAVMIYPQSEVNETLDEEGAWVQAWVWVPKDDTETK